MKARLRIAARWVRHRWVMSLLLGLTIAIVTGLLWPSQPLIPVRGTTPADWNPQTFWYEPWGASGVHKGIDIFAKRGADVLAATGGIVLFAGKIRVGGQIVLVLGPKWRLHYYAHLDEVSVSIGELVSRGERVGAVGTSGNAAGKPPHLHYSIMTLVPYPWRITRETQGWKKMFYLDPGAELGGLR